MQYKIKSGDWLSKIASRYGMTWQELYEYDGGTGKSNKERLNEQKRNKGRPESSIDNPSSIYPDDVILVPDTAEGVVSADSGTFKAKVKATKMHPRITVVGAVQADHPSFENVKRGGYVGDTFKKKFGSVKTANKAAMLAGKGDGVQNVKGRYALKISEEPAYVDSGADIAKAPGKAFVIGNDNNDNNTKMGSYGPINQKLSACFKDAEKMKATLESKSQKFSVGPPNPKGQTGQEIRARVNDAISSLKPDTSCVFYFSGHGVIEGLVGTDGKILSPNDVVALVKKAIEVDSDLVFLADACHSGITVDACRVVLLERAKEHYKNNAKMKLFVEAALDLADAKNKLMNNPVHELWKKDWKSGDLSFSQDPKDQSESARLHDEVWRDWFKVWNDFVDSVQTKVDDTVQKGKAAGVKAENLKLQKYSAQQMSKGFINSDERQEMWAQLDLLDDLMNLAV